ncbi:uncharacterized protein LOC135844449 [Planococcus citri]|uniref:uncharacterized protein LOC135844449 n=1 Tax=Planococcus citri TaxID=170843 RepID=UPI0031F7CFD4
MIKQHIKSFKPVQSHYSQRKAPKKVFLPETLNAARMHEMFVNENQLRVSYNTYLEVFNKFNIGFGLPKSDTCGTCDAMKANPTSSEEYYMHLSEAQMWYDFRSTIKKRSKKRRSKIQAISFDYMKNLPLPHIRTNIVYYTRQLWYYVFGIHDFTTDAGTMYCYHEGEAKKGCCDVTSMLFHYLKSFKNEKKDELYLFSDGCPGQNKNHCMIYFSYMLVHVFRLYKSITHAFPIRGHSFLDNDTDFSNISKRVRLETIQTIEEWNHVIEAARKKPSFEVVHPETSDFHDMLSALQPYFLKTAKPALKLREIKMYRIRESTADIEVKYQYDEKKWSTCTIRNRKKLPDELDLKLMYEEPISVRGSKITDLKKLLPFVKRENHPFYNDLISKYEEECRIQAEKLAAAKAAAKAAAESSETAKSPENTEAVLATNDDSESEYEMLSVEEFYSDNSSGDEM